MRHSQLVAFHNVARHGGFSRAAEAMSVSQPAVSEQVRKLEQENDVLLFHRDRKLVRLTTEGEGLFLLTKKMFEMEEQIADYMSESRAVLDGVLRIIVDSAHHITDLLSEFRRLHPRIRISLRTGNSEDVLAALRNYDAEIGVVGSLAPGKDMEICDFGASPIVAFAARGFLHDVGRAYTLQELAKMPLVFREKSSKTRQKLQAEAAKIGVQLRPVIEAEGREAMREIVASGAGIGFVSLAEFGHDQRIVKLDIAGCDIQMNEALVFLSQRHDVRVIRTFVEFAKSNIQPNTT